MNLIKFKSDKSDKIDILQYNTSYNVCNHIPLIISSSNKVIKLKQIELNHRELEIDTYMKNLEILNIKINELTYSLQRVKSMTKLASIKEKLLYDSCNF